ncbi:MAG TPA: hypothetical protein VGJ05_09120 [Fimbriiglobus sp.]|jgi:hypothetical protein
MISVDQLADEARKYRQALPTDSDESVRKYLWDVITRDDAGFQYVDQVTGWKLGGCLGILVACFLKMLGFMGVLLILATYVFAVLPVQVRNWRVTPEYDRRIGQAVTAPGR